MITLYQFPLSHYCEKVRWALEYKELPYTTCNLMPGPHFKIIAKLPVQGSSVPVIHDNDHYIQGSNNILTYLDQTYLANSLSPQDPQLKEEALDWEAFADEEIGPHIRRCFYYIFFNHKKDLLYYLAYKAPWHKKALLSLIYPLIKKKILEGLDINKATYEASKVKLYNNLDQLSQFLNGKDFLVGSSFTRADLAVASLIAPVYQFEKYGLEKRPFPDAFARLAAELKEKSTWVPEIYKKYR